MTIIDVSRPSWRERRRSRMVHVAAGPYGKLRVFRSVWKMYFRIVFDGANPYHAATLLQYVRGHPTFLHPLGAGAAIAGGIRYQRRRIMR